MVNRSLVQAIVRTGEDLGVEVDEFRNRGAGEVDVVWRMNLHPGLPNLNIGFYAISEEDEMEIPDLTDLIGRGALSALDRLVFVTDSEAEKEMLNGLVDQFDDIGGRLKLDKFVTVITENELLTEPGERAERRARSMRGEQPMQKRPPRTTRLRRNPHGA